MGVRGQRPKPARLKIIQGNPGKRPINMDEPKIRADLSVAPDWMDGEKLDLWRYAIREAPAGVVGTIDRDLLVTWVTACSMRDEAIKTQAKLDETSGLKLLTKNKDGSVRASPYISIINKQSEIMMRAAGELGFTPSSRARLSVPEKKDKPGNPFHNL